MIKCLSIIVGFLFFVQVSAQTGIGTTSPDPSAKLDITSSNKGFLPPRVTLTSGTDNSTIPNPATGLLVYNTGNNTGLLAGYYYWNGSSWATIATSTGSGVSSSFMRGSRSAAQTGSLSTNALVAFSQVENSMGSDISLNTSTGQITLAPNKTYRLTGMVPGFTTSGGDIRPQFMWYNETSSAWIGSSSESYSPSSGAGFGAFGGFSSALITTNASTVVSFRILQSNTGLASLGGNTDFSSTGSYPWFEIQVISGNAPFNQFNYGDVKTGFQSADHNGWIKLDGRLKSSLTSSQQTQATALGIGTNLPNATNAFLVQNGGTIGAVSGSNSRTISQANLPNINFPTATTSYNGDHSHTFYHPQGDQNYNNGSGNTWWGGSWGYGAGTSTNGAHTHTVTVSSGGSGTALDITPQSLTVNTFIYLGY